jgi:hypothetical protein
LTTVADGRARLNAICPYFTMFPLSFPLTVLKDHARPNAAVFDPFCGRGTTNFAARLLGLKTAGVDSSAVASAATQAKLVTVQPQAIVRAAQQLLTCSASPAVVPVGPFWELAYERSVLRDLCRLRQGLQDGRVAKPIAAALRGIILGALHGPMGRTKQSYFSNQAPRTYAPKPAYAVRFWTERQLVPPRVDVLQVIAERAQRFYCEESSAVRSQALLGDSRDPACITRARRSIGAFDWIITSPPYFGLRTYVQDQWLRHWFLGGSSRIDYRVEAQVSHRGRDAFLADLRQVWINVGKCSAPDATLVVRFGSIGDRAVADPAAFIAASFADTGWCIESKVDARSAARGKRQAATFGAAQNAARDEVDVWAVWQGK